MDLLVGLALASRVAGVSTWAENRYYYNNYYYFSSWAVGLQPQLKLVDIKWSGPLLLGMSYF